MPSLAFSAADWATFISFAAE
ncbi:hypothetical protein [Streptomyces sp. NBC_00444]